MKVEFTNEQAQYLANLLDAEVKRGGLQAAMIAGPIGDIVLALKNVGILAAS